MNLKGNFEPSSLATILQMLGNDEKTGLLRLTSQDNDVSIFLKDGTVIYARGTIQESMLGQMLVAKGVINPEDLDKCLEEARKDKQALGNILVKKGHVSIKNLKKHISEQAVEVICSVFFWDGGRFHYTDSELIPPGVLVTRLDIMSIILEATHRIDEFSVLKKRITDDEVVLRVTDMAGADQVKLSPVEWRFRSMVDGKRKVGDIIRKSGYDKFSVYKILYSLVSFGLVEKDEEIESRNAAYGPTIDLYRNFWNVIRDELENALGERTFIIAGKLPPMTRLKQKDFVRHLHETELWRWISAIIVQAKPDAPEFAELFSDFNPDNTASKNREVFFKRLLNHSLEQGSEDLARGFKVYLANILDSLPALIGGFRTLDVITALIQSLTEASGSLKEDMQQHLDEVQTVFAMASQHIAEQLNKEEEKPFGLFVLQNRKYL